MGDAVLFFFVYVPLHLHTNKGGVINTDEELLKNLRLFCMILAGIVETGNKSAIRDNDTHRKNIAKL